MVIARGKGGGKLEKGIEGINGDVMKGDLTWGDEHPVHYTNDTL